MDAVIQLHTLMLQSVVEVLMMVAVNQNHLQVVLIVSLIAMAMELSVSLLVTSVMDHLIMVMHHGLLTVQMVLMK